MRLPSFTAVLALSAAALTAAEAPIAIRGARIVTVSGPTIEKGTLVLAGGKIAAIGADVAVPAGATVIDGSGKTVYPGLIDGLTTLGLVEIGSVAGSVDTAEAGDVNPHAKAWVAVHAHSELLPVARANGLTAALAAPQGGLVSGQSALIRLAGSTPDALTVKTPVAMHVTYPTGRAPFDFSRMFDEPELKTFEERQKERKKNQEKDLRRLANLLAEAKAYGAALEAAKSGKGAPPKPDLPMEALAPVARGELAVIMRADDEADIRGAVKFAADQGLKLVIAGGLEAWRCTDVLKEKAVPVLINVDRLPRKESDPYDAAYANPGLLFKAGVRFAIVSDDASQSRNLPYEAAMASAYGLPAEIALRSITLSPAEIFGVANRIGSLEVGKDANLVIATGDILDHRTQVTGVFIDGVAQSIETRHTRLYQQFKDRP
ncbi:MAG TPA: amidohydrolase family protein [Vicinamibacteria bacterium]|nr:amidohydrolase family protein [Vicinamibacteria bacterium]